MTPAPGPQKVWSLTDRLGRSVGQITQIAEGQFLIAGGSNTPLSNAVTVQPSLDAAMNEVEKRLRGVCQFSSGTDQ